MNTYLKLDVNIFCVIILIFIYIKFSNSQKDIKNYLKFLKITYISTISILITDIFVNIFEMNLTNIIAVNITKFLISLNGIYTITACWSWTIFLMFYLNPNDKNIKRNIVVVAFPLILNFVLSIVNIFKPIYFNVTLENGYTRFKYFYIFASCAFIYMLLSVIIIIKERKNINSLKFILLLSFEFLPALGGTLQIIFYGTLFTYPFAALALTLIYVGLNDDLSILNYVSNAYSNNYLTTFLEKYIIDLKKNDYSLAYIDIDDLGKINKKFGEKEGDFLLKKFTEIVNDCITDPDFISTAGGDEFIIYFNNNDEKQILNNLKIISRNVEYYNKTSDKPYDIKFTFVYHINTTENASPYKILKNLYLKIANKKQKKLFS